MLTTMFWFSFFTLYWLLLLGEVKADTMSLMSLAFFAVGGTMWSISAASSRERAQKEEKERPE